MAVGGKDSGSTDNSPTTGQRRNISTEPKLKSQFATNKNAQNGMPSLEGGSNPEIPDVTTAGTPGRTV